MTTDPTSVCQFNGKEIMEGLNFISATRLKEETGKTTWLVKTLTGDTIIVIAELIHWPLHQPYTDYTVHWGKSIEKYAEKQTLSQSPAHHLLTQLV